MSKFSSFKKSQLLFENWRGYVNEGEADEYEKSLRKQSYMQHGEETEDTEYSRELAGFLLDGIPQYSGEDRDNLINQIDKILQKADVVRDLYDVVQNIPERSPEEEGGEEESKQGRDLEMDWLAKNYRGLREQRSDVSPRVSSIGKLLNGITAEELSQVQALLSQAEEESPL